MERCEVLAYPKLGAPITTMEPARCRGLPLEPMKLLMDELLEETREQNGLHRRLSLRLPHRLRLGLHLGLAGERASSRTGRAKRSFGC